VGGKSPRFTKAFRESPAIINSIVTFSAQAQTPSGDSEGTQLQFGQIRYRLELFIQGKAPDGMDIDRLPTISMGRLQGTRRMTKRSTRQKRRCARN